MAKITANNIFTGAITSDKLDSSVASNLATANNANVVATIASTVAAAAFSTANNLSSILANSAPIITSITIADSSYNALDDTAANTTGGFCIITGSGFVSTPTVVFGTTSAPAVSFISSTTLRVQIPALTAASYPVYVVNSNGGTAIRVNGVTTSSFPAWGTASALANTAANTVFSVSLSANSDSSITYSNTTSLPTGTTLAANGLFSGTVTIGTQTTYTFDVKATDVELQDASRTFSLTVTVIPAVRLFVWGNNSSGALGLNDTTNRSSPVQIGSQTDWSIGDGKMDMGQPSAAIKNNGTLWLWGHNTYGGSLGQNDMINRSSPTQVGSGTDWNFVATSTYQSFAIKTNGTLWTWGGRGNFPQVNFGQNGLSTNYASSSRSSPTQIGSDTTWSLVSAGQYCAGAIKTDGTLWTWGRNTNGQLGMNNTTDRSSPVQVGSGNTWTQLFMGAGNAFALKSDGTLWAWGNNDDGVSGHNNIIAKSSPTQVGTGTNWSRVSGFQSVTNAIKTDGTLWSWGDNTQGQLGQNDTIKRSSPTQVGTGTNWSRVSSHQSNMTSAIKTDGTLWTWGINNQGQLGILNPQYRYESSPVQVGTETGWNNVVQASVSLMATRII